MLADRRHGPAGVQAEVGAVRGGRTQRVPVFCAISGCIEYDGSKPSAARPGPPKASSSCCMISLEPLAAQSCRAVSPCPR